MERVLSECEFLVGIYVMRYEDPGKSKFVTSQWLMRETFTAHGQSKKFIALEVGLTHRLAANRSSKSQPLRPVDMSTYHVSFGP